MSTPFKPSAALVAAQTATLARLAKIQDQFNQTAGSGRLANKVAILTGCGSLKGIGRATAVLFAREGADIVARDHTDRTDFYSSRNQERNIFM